MLSVGARAATAANSVVTRDVASEIGPAGLPRRRSWRLACLLAVPRPAGRLGADAYDETFLKESVFHRCIAKMQPEVRDGLATQEKGHP